MMWGGALAQRLIYAYKTGPRRAVYLYEACFPHAFYILELITVQSLFTFRKWSESVD